LFERVWGIVILAILVLTILADLNFNITPILTGAGILGLAVGLGSQNVMKDIIGGIFIFLEGNFNEGDKVKIAGVSGQVAKMTLRKTYLRSDKTKSLHIIPNWEIKTITVISAQPNNQNGWGLAKEKKYGK